MKSLYILLIAVLIALAVASKPINCGDDHENKKVGRKYEQKVRRCKAHVGELKIDCQTTKKVKICEAVKKVEKRCAFLQKEAHFWMHRCQIMAFRMNRRLFYKYLQEVRTYSKKANAHKKKYEQAKAKAAAEDKEAAQHNKEAMNHIMKFKQFLGLYKLSVQKLKIITNDHKRLESELKEIKHNASDYAAKSSRFHKDAQAKLAHYNKLKIQLVDYEKKIQHHKKLMNEHANKKTLHSIKYEQHMNNAKKEKKEFDHMENKKNQVKKSFQARIKNDPVYKKSCEKRIKKCAEQHGWLGASFKKCARRCF